METHKHSCECPHCGVASCKNCLTELERLARLGAAVEAMPLEVLLTHTSADEWDIYRFVDSNSGIVDHVGYGSGALEAIQLHANEA